MGKARRRNILIPILTACAMGSGISADGALYLLGVDGDHAREFRHDRFYDGADRAFLGEPYDWSGIGWTDGERWLVMISPRHFLGAHHWRPATGDAVTFYSDNDPDDGRRYTIDNWGYRTSYDGSDAEGMRSDLWVGRLTEPLDPADGIAVYPIYSVPDNRMRRKEIFVYGRPHRLGRNLVTAIDDLDEREMDRVMVYTFNDPSPVGEDEAYLMSGDSGGPSFVVHNGRLAVVGVHFTNEGSPAPGLQSSDSYVPFYLDQIRAAIAPDTIVAVPATSALEIY